MTRPARRPATGAVIRDYHASAGQALVSCEEQRTVGTNTFHKYDQQNLDLLCLLPVGTCDLDALPEDLACKLFEALRLEIHDNKTDNTAVCRITLSGETLPTLQRTTQESGVVIPFKKATGKKPGAKTYANEKDEAPSDPSPCSHLLRAPGRI